ncbi:MAG: hypothetical protein J5965_05295 [Aeriscardovia sp.]|nr:hypothetical protein [Aeriscardovia sp.]
MSSGAKRVILDEFDNHGLRKNELSRLRELVEENSDLISYEDAEKIYNAAFEFVIQHDRIPMNNSKDSAELLDIAFGKSTDV